jgi:hypothetical protein
MLTPNAFAARSTAKLPAERAMHTSISGGSRETEANAETVIPTGPSSPVAVTTVTPAAKRLMASLKSSGSSNSDCDDTRPPPTGMITSHPIGWLTPHGLTGHSCEV